MIEPVAGLYQTEPRLLVQSWIVTKPDHDRTGVCIEIQFVVQRP